MCKRCSSTIIIKIKIWLENVLFFGGFVVSEFEINFRLYVYFRTNTLGKVMNSLFLPAIVFQGGWLWHEIIYNGSYAIKHWNQLRFRTDSCAITILLLLCYMYTSIECLKGYFPEFYPLYIRSRLQMFCPRFYPMNIGKY